MRHRYLRAERRRDSGFVSLYLVAVILGLLALAGLVVDGGRGLASRERTADVAQQAARAGADALAPGSLRSAALPVADPGAAKDAAIKVLSAAGLEGEVSIRADRVVVRAHSRQVTTILSAVGIDQLTVTATESAILVRGTTAEAH